MENRPGPLMLLPAVLGMALVVALGALAVLSWHRAQVRGERVAMEFDAPCEVWGLLGQRASEIGLGDPEAVPTAGGARLEATLPGLPDDRSAIPALLVRPGRLHVRAGGELLASELDVVGAALRIDPQGLPYTEVEFAPTAAARVARARDVVIQVDDEVEVLPPGAIPENPLKIPTSSGTPAERLRRATDRAIVLAHGPMPCSVSVRSVSPVPIRGLDAASSPGS